ncbi:AP-4 complex subunit mu-1 [Hordeum vulgare]|nr:AP-4 complex subunit mu-1 [Hordeum vulgare]
MRSHETFNPGPRLLLLFLPATRQFQRSAQPGPTQPGGGDGDGERDRERAQAPYRSAQRPARESALVQHLTKFHLHSCVALDLMFDDQDLGFFTNFLGIFIFVLVIAYHFVMADPKYEN